jgi:pimeloyl-ACP methyl ester carboxylesterase
MFFSTHYQACGLALWLLCGATFSVSYAIAEPPTYSNHEDLSYYLKPDGTRAPIHSPDDWQMRRKSIIAGMEEALGPLPNPKKPVPLDVQIVEEHKEDGYIRRKLAYHTDDPAKRVRAWLLLPTIKTSEKRPGILCLQQTTKNGKDSPVGLADRPTLHYALELAKRGYVTLSPDYPSFGEYEYDFDADNYISGSMKAIYDNTRAIDLLQSLPEVDADRVGCIGHSLGGHNSLFTAAFDPRVKAVVTSCGFTSFRKYMKGDLKGWAGERYMPLVAIKYNYSPDRMPFDFPEILAAIAPRGVFVVAPLRDDNFDVEGVRTCIAAAEPIFKLLGKPDNLQVVYPDAAHDFPDAEREQAYKFLDRVLKHGRGAE